MKDNKCKRILALIGVVLLTGMYLMTLVFAFVDADHADEYKIFLLFLHSILKGFSSLEIGRAHV